MPRVTAEQARDEILLLFKAWTRAVGVAKDRDFLDRHVDGGWIYTDFNGKLRTRDEYLKLVDSMVSYTQEMQRFDARIAGEDIALVTGVYRARAEIQGGIQLDNTIAFSAVWELRDGVWKALLLHTTRVADAP